jgi:2-methylcitrate dehydratase PrpD
MSAIRNKNQTAEEQLASFIVGTDYKDLPREVIEISKNAILDLIGVALAGSSEPPGKILLEELKESRGQSQAGVIGGGFRTSVTLASLCNGTMAHALDYDDVSENWTGHPSTVLVPSILAMGENCHSTGKEILTAYVVGFEVGAKLGIGIGKFMYGRGWHNTSTIGSIASAAAAAKLLKLGVEETKMALGIAASLASGLRENFGTMTKPLHAGNAARNGNLAGLLAKRGFTSSERWLTADSGFSKAFGAENDGLNDALSELGKQFSTISPGIQLKYYPSCNGTHSPLEATLKLRKQYSLNPKDIAGVDCAVAPYLPHMLIHHHPKTGLEGKFSLEFAVSVALIDGKAFLPQFTDERVSAPDIQAFIPKIKYHVLPELGNVFDMNLPVTIAITLKNGEKVSITENNATGKPTNPMSPEQLRNKFENCTRILSQGDRAEVVELVSNMEKLDGIDNLMNLIVGRSQ